MAGCNVLAWPRGRQQRASGGQVCIAAFRCAIPTIAAPGGRSASTTRPRSLGRRSPKWPSTAFSFFAESPGTPWPSDPGEYTAFAAAVATERAIDLTIAPLVGHRARWSHLTDYAATQDLADAARAASVEIIRYESVRDPHAGANLALLTCLAFAEARPVERQTWRIRLSASGIQAICEFPDIRIGFDRTAFAADPRIAAFDWDRGLNS